MESSSTCSIGRLTNTECHIGKYPKNLLTLEENDKRLIKIRIQADGTDICCYHKNYYLENYTFHFGRKCADPDGIHKRTCKGAQVITEEMHQATSKLIPGQKLCQHCFKKYEVLQDSTSSQGSQDQTTTSQGSQDQPATQSSGSIFEDEIELFNKLQKIMEELGLETMDYADLRRLPQERRREAVKSCLDSLYTAAADKYASCLDCSASHIKHDRFADLLLKLIAKYPESDYNTKIKILSIMPDSYSQADLITMFNTTEYMVRKARKLTSEQGILPDVPPKAPRRRLDQSTIDKVIEFYNSDEISVVMSGMRDYVSVKNSDGVKVKMQKRLLQFSLREVYQLFKLKYKNDVKIGFSKFADLRPKYCIIAGEKETWNCCVCVYCQNLKLSMKPFINETKIQSMLEQIVCDFNSEHCMLHDCNKCANLSEVETIVETNIDADKEFFTYKQWSTDSTLIETTVDRADFISNVSNALLEIKDHYFINKKQKEYLQESKQKLKKNECIIICDFAENYSFLIQDSIQSYYFKTPQATVHPFSIYYLDDVGALKTKSICVISDCTSHNTASFYAFLKEVLAEIKLFLPNVNYIKYFSDGCAAQYKNCKNFANLLKHKEDFGIEAEWNFFASCHGKNSCDAIGAVLKRFVKLAAMRGKTISTPKEMFDYCVQKQKDLKIITLYVDSKTIAKIEKKTLNRRFLLAQTVQGTRKYHQFKPSGDLTVNVKITSLSRFVDTADVFVQ